MKARHRHAADAHPLTLLDQIPCAKQETPAGGEGAAPEEVNTSRAFPVAPRDPARSYTHMAPSSTVDESFARLQRAGWSVGDVRLLTAVGLRWWVTGVNGENAVSARGCTQAEAWQNACLRARALGMLRG
jgi:hypothetical protein